MDVLIKINRAILIAPIIFIFFASFGFNNSEALSQDIPSNENAHVGFLWIEIYENQSVFVELPSELEVSSVHFASYGMPYGQAGAYSIGECHSENSLYVAESIMLGQTVFEVSANNGMFGDPCPGVYKRLYIAAFLKFKKAPETTVPTTTIPDTTTIQETTTTESTTTTALPATTIPSTTTSTTAVQSTVPPSVVPTTTFPEIFTQPEVPSNVMPMQEVITSPLFINSLTAEQAGEFFSSLDLAAIPEQQVAEMVAVIQEAPIHVRQEFEKTIEEITEAIGSYVPIDQKVSLATRQILIAASAVIAVAGTISIDTQINRGRSR